MTRRALASLSRAVLASAAALVVALVISGPAAAADVQQTAFGFGSDWKAEFNYSFAESPYDPAFDDSGWETMQAPFGNGAEPRCGFPAAATDFPENSYLVARKTFTLPAGAHSLQLSGTIDNYLYVQVNGNYVGDVWNGDCQQFGVDVRVPDDYLNVGGPNVVVVYAGDAGSATFFDLKGSYLAPDTTPPTVTAPSDQTLEASGPGGAVGTFSAPATDAMDGSVPVSCSPASGSTFPLGTTHVTCSASDAAGNEGSAGFDITVEDTTKPQLDLPTPKVDATSPSGAKVTYTATAQDSVSGIVPVTCSPASGTTFAIGTTTVSCSARDAAGNEQSGTFEVLVRAASEQVADLAAQIKAINLTQGIANSIDTKLAEAQVALAEAKQGDKTSTCGKLGAVDNKIQSQAVVKEITQAQADALSAKVRQIRAVIGC